MWMKSRFIWECHLIVHHFLGILMMVYTFTNSYPSFQHHYNHHPSSSSSSSSSQNKTNMKSTTMHLSQHPPNVQNANLDAKNYGCDDSSWLSPCHDDITMGVTRYMAIIFF